MRVLTRSARKVLAQGEWHPYFVLWPLLMPDGREWVWLETIERRYWVSCGKMICSYRDPCDGNGTPLRRD